MGKDNVVKIMEELTIDKNREITLQLAELKKRRDEENKRYNGITKYELDGLSYLIK